LTFDRPIDGVRVRLAQPSVQAAISPFLNAEVTLANDTAVYDRFWVEFGADAAAGHVSTTNLGQSVATPIRVFAYPNILRWETNATKSLTLSARAEFGGLTPWTTPTRERAVPTIPGTPFTITIPLTGRALPAHASGMVTFKNGTTTEATVQLDLP
jgi:hypothetical protein